MMQADEERSELGDDHSVPAPPRTAASEGFPFNLMSRFTRWLFWGHRDDRLSQEILMVRRYQSEGPGECRIEDPRDTVRHMSCWKRFWRTCVESCWAPKGRLLRYLSDRSEELYAAYLEQVYYYRMLFCMGFFVVFYGVLVWQWWGSMRVMTTLEGMGVEEHGLREERSDLMDAVDELEVLLVWLSVTSVGILASGGIAIGALSWWSVKTVANVAGYVPPAKPIADLDKAKAVPGGAKAPGPPPGGAKAPGPPAAAKAPPAGPPPAAAKAPAPGPPAAAKAPAPGPPAAAKAPHSRPADPFPTLAPQISVTDETSTSTTVLAPQPPPAAPVGESLLHGRKKRNKRHGRFRGIARRGSTGSALAADDEDDESEMQPLIQRSALGVDDIDYDADEEDIPLPRPRRGWAEWFGFQFNKILFWRSKPTQDTTPPVTPPDTPRSSQGGSIKYIRLSPVPLDLISVWSWLMANLVLILACGLVAYRLHSVLDMIPMDSTTSELLAIALLKNSGDAILLWGCAFCIVVDFIAPTRVWLSGPPHLILLICLAACSIVLGKTMPPLVATPSPSILCLIPIIVISFLGRYAIERPHRIAFLNMQDKASAGLMEGEPVLLNAMLGVQRLNHYLGELGTTTSRSDLIELRRACLKLVSNPEMMMTAGPNTEPKPQFDDFSLMFGINVCDLLPVVSVPNWYALKPIPNVFPELCVGPGIPDVVKDAHAVLAAELVAKVGVDFDLNMLQVAIESHGHALSEVGCALMAHAVIPMSKTGRYAPLVPKGLDLQKLKVSRLMNAIQTRYFNVAYHNNTHGAQVAHHTTWLIRHVGVKHLLSYTEMASSILAALAHDVGHPGVMNPFLTSTQHFLALTYNDLNVLEQYHCSNLFKILEMPAVNILSETRGPEWQSLRRLMIDMIMATDMADHFEIMARYQLRLNADDFLSPATKEHDKRLLLQLCLKTADLGYLALPYGQCLSWANMVYQEFWKQGEIEESFGLPKSYLCDRADEGTAKWYSTNGRFAAAFVMPLFQQIVLTEQYFARVARETQDEMLDYLKSRQSLSSVISGMEEDELPDVESEGSVSAEQGRTGAVTWSEERKLTELKLSEDVRRASAEARLGQRRRFSGVVLDLPEASVPFQVRQTLLEPPNRSDFVTRMTRRSLTPEDTRDFQATAQLLQAFARGGARETRPPSSLPASPLIYPLDTPPYGPLQPTLMDSVIPALPSAAAAAAHPPAPRATSALPSAAAAAHPLAARAAYALPSAAAAAAHPSAARATSALPKAGTVFTSAPPISDSPDMGRSGPLIPDTAHIPYRVPEPREHSGSDTSYPTTLSESSMYQASELQRWVPTVTSLLDDDLEAADDHVEITDAGVDGDVDSGRSGSSVDDGTEERRARARPRRDGPQKLVESSLLLQRLKARLQDNIKKFTAKSEEIESNDREVKARMGL